MPDINLAPGTQFVLQARRRRRRLFMLSAFVVVLALVVWGALFLYLNRLESQQADIANQLRNVELEIASLEKEAQRIVLFEKRLTSLDSLLNSHVSWDKLLQDVERLMPGETVLTNLAVSKNGGTASVRGLTPNIDQVAVTFASLLETDTHTTVFKDARLGSVNREEVAGGELDPAQVRYRFDANLTFDPNILRQGN